jgi:hypothetical protein
LFYCCSGSHWREQLSSSAGGNSICQVELVCNPPRQVEDVHVVDRLDECKYIVGLGWGGIDYGEVQIRRVRQRIGRGGRGKTGHPTGD